MSLCNQCIDAITAMFKDYFNSFHVCLDVSIDLVIKMYENTIMKFVLKIVLHFELPNEVSEPFKT